MENLVISQSHLVVTTVVVQAHLVVTRIEGTCCNVIIVDAWVTLRNNATKLLDI